MVATCGAWQWKNLCMHLHNNILHKKDYKNMIGPSYCITPTHIRKQGFWLDASLSPSFMWSHQIHFFKNSFVPTDNPKILPHALFTRKTRHLIGRQLIASTHAITLCTEGPFFHFSFVSLCRQSQDTPTHFVRKKNNASDWTPAYTPTLMT